MVVDGDEFYSARRITFFSLKRWKGGGKVVERWWKGGGKVVERWWKGGAGIRYPFSLSKISGVQKDAMFVGLQDVNWMMCPPFPGFQVFYL